MIGRGARRLLGLAVALLLVASCRMDLDVDVAMEADGSGQVAVELAVDEEALARVGGDLAAVVDLERLAGAGWSFEPPTRGDDGRTRLRLEHPFATPADGEAVLAGLAGEDGPLQDLTLERRRARFEDRWRFAGRVDFGRGVGAAVVDDEAAAALADQLGEAVDRLVQVRVRVRLPGEVTSNATTRADNGAVWAVGLGDEPVVLEAVGTQRRTGVVAVAIGAGALLAVGVVVGLAALLVRLAVRRHDGVSGWGRGGP